MVTIKEARKLLGNKYTNLSDEEVQLKINSLGKIADVLVDAVLQKLDTINTNETSNNTSESLIS